MSESMNELYARYVAVIKFFNTELNRSELRSSTLATLKLHALSADEFPEWWAHICSVKELHARWIDRLNDPAEAWRKACQETANELGKIPIRRVAA